MSNDKAMAAALRLLNRRWHTEYELTVKLSTKGYTDKEISAVIEQLKSLDYLNDERFVIQWVNDRKRLKPMGKLRLRKELAAKGVSGHLLEQKLEELLPEYEEYQLALTLAEKRLQRPAAQWHKVAAFLVRRGFPFGIVTRVGRKLDI